MAHYVLVMLLCVHGKMAVFTPYIVHSWGCVTLAIWGTLGSWLMPAREILSWTVLILDLQRESERFVSSGKCEVTLAILLSISTITISLSTDTEEMRRHLGYSSPAAVPTMTEQKKQELYYVFIMSPFSWQCRQLWWWQERKSVQS